MNKLILTLAFSIVFGYSFAQENTGFKPSAKNFTSEVNLDLFSSSPISINYLRFRTFTSERGAVRLGLSIGANTENPEKYEKDQTFEINLRPGYEWHFAGTERLSPYVGAEIDFAIKSSKVIGTEPDNKYTLEGAWNEFGTERGFTRIGANVVFGVDIYIIRRLYLGTEIGFGFENVKTDDIKVKSDSFNETLSEGGSSFQIGPNFNSSIRLGFVF